jgi:prepilin-type processing-associated H-X9-DG protein
MFSGVDLDINRWTLGPPLEDGSFTAARRFGSAHPGGCQFVMCDGSVRTISYAIDAIVHRRLGNRKDGNVVEVP